MNDYDKLIVDLQLIAKCSKLIKFNLDAMIGIATSIKPKFGEACNNCGWCCMTEVCPVGQNLSGSDELPCNFLEDSGNNKYHCIVVRDNKLANSVLGIGAGCDAKTQTEQIFEIMDEKKMK